MLTLCKKYVKFVLSLHCRLRGRLCAQLATVVTSATRARDGELDMRLGAANNRAQAGSKQIEKLT